MASLAGPVLGSVASAGAQRLFGGGGRSAGLQQLQSSGFSGGGLTGTTSPDGIFSVRQSAPRRRNLRNLANASLDAAGEIGTLREGLAPGFGQVTSARLNAIGDRRRAAIGNLRDNLARRRLAGSSFAADALSRAEAEFGREEANARAQGFLEELDANANLLTREAALRAQGFQTFVNNANLNAELAQRGQQILSNNAGTIADLEARAAAGRGQFAGSLAQPVVSALGDFDFGKLFG